MKLNRALTIGTRYNAIKKSESSASATELAKVHDVGEAAVADIKKWRCHTENYLKLADSSVAATVEKYADVMKRFNRNKGDNNDNFIQMETANENNNREVLSYAEGIEKKRVSALPSTKRTQLLCSYLCWKSYVTWQSKRYGI